ncbi:MAG: tyrosine-type recombinase/integrase, partial [Thermodesulfobium sp.]
MDALRAPFQYPWLKSHGSIEKTMFYLLFGTGVRLREACDLKIYNIMEDRIIVQGKGQKIREIYLPHEAKQAIEEYMKARYPTDRDYLFTTKAHKMTYDYFRKRC